MHKLIQFFFLIFFCGVSSEKRGLINSWASELNLTGIVVAGKPGGYTRSRLLPLAPSSSSLSPLFASLPPCSSLCPLPFFLPQHVLCVWKLQLHSLVVVLCTSGLVCVEGDSDDVSEYVKRLRRLPWQKMSCKLHQEFAVTDGTTTHTPSPPLSHTKHSHSSRSSHSPHFLPLFPICVLCFFTCPYFFCLVVLFFSCVRSQQQVRPTMKLYGNFHGFPTCLMTATLLCNNTSALWGCTQNLSKCLVYPSCSTSNHKAQNKYFSLFWFDFTVFCVSLSSCVSTFLC